MSNLIEQLGGYYIARAEYKMPVKLLNIDYEQLATELLECRRAHSIFEEGDSVMYEGKLYEIKYIYHSERARITDGFQGRTIYDFPKGIRHATDAEIKAGHRLPRLEVLNDIDLPPNTIILGDK